MEYYRWAVRSQLRAEGRRFAVAVARHAEVPVLGLHGADDPWLLPRTAAASTPWAGERHTLEVLPGIGHFPHEERPAVVTARIADFLGRWAGDRHSPPEADSPCRMRTHRVESDSPCE